MDRAQLDWLCCKAEAALGRIRDGASRLLDEAGSSELEDLIRQFCR